MGKRWGMWGLAAGLIVTAPLMAVQFLVQRLVGLPFAPFDLFDWLARVLPGNVITAGIDAIVGVIGGLDLGQTSSTAKTIERLMALGLFAAIGSAAGAILFAALATRRARRGWQAGLGLGLILGVLLLLVSASLGLPEITPLLGALWVLGSLAAWGLALGWLYDRLAAPEAARPVLRPASESAPAGMASNEQAVAASTLSRRQFLVQVGGAAAVITVSGAGLGMLLSERQRAAVTVAAALTGGQDLPPGLPNAADPLIPAPGTRLEYTPLAEHYRIDINLVSPRVSEQTWVLTIDGLVDHPLALTLDDLRGNYPAIDQYVTLACISNPVGGDLIGTTRWTGVSLQRVLADAGIHDGAGYLLIRSADGFYETLALDLVRADERIMLCYAWDGQPLTVDHGFPLRIYIPDRYGMKQPKWITEIHVSADYEDGYWVERGWDAVAQMRTTAVIDTVAAQALVDAGGQLRVPVGGIAHAGARGISKVEVQVDNGEWQAARLRAPLSETTWVIWRYDWPFAEGQHTFAVRAYDGDGIVQDDTQRGPRPSGATGIHGRSATLVAPADQTG